MAIKTATVRVAANTGIGTQDITVSGFGTPKAAYFIMSYAIADDIAAAHTGLSCGATDGTNQFCVHGNSENGATPSDCNCEIFLDSCIAIDTAGTSSTISNAAFDSWITDGVRIDWTIVSGAYLLTVILFGGDDLSAFVGSEVLSNIVDTAHVVSNVGFEPHLVLTGMSDERNAGSLTAGHSRYTFGAVHNDEAGTITQRCFIHYEQTGQNPSRIATYMSANYGCGHVAIADGSLDWGGEFSAFTSNGFTITERVNGANGTLVFYLCLRGASPDDFAVGTYPTPTSTGDDSEASINFKPQLAMFGMSHVDSVDSGAIDDNAGTQGISAFTDTSEFSVSVQAEDGVNPTNTESLSVARAIESPLDNGLTGISADFVSMDTLGFTLNYSATLAAARQFWYAAIKAEAAEVGDTFNEHPWTVPAMWYLPYWKHR